MHRANWWRGHVGRRATNPPPPSPPRRRQARSCPPASAKAGTRPESIGHDPEAACWFSLPPNPNTYKSMVSIPDLTVDIYQDERSGFSISTPQIVCM